MSIISVQMSPGCPVSWRMNNIMISFVYVSEHLDFFFFKRIATFSFSNADLITINYLFNQIHTYYYNIWCTMVNSILPRPSLQFLRQKKIIITTLKSLFSTYEGMNMCSTVTILTVLIEQGSSPCLVLFRMGDLSQQSHQYLLMSLSHSRASVESVII